MTVSGFDAARRRHAARSSRVSGHRRVPAAVSAAGGGALVPGADGSDAVGVALEPDAHPDASAASVRRVVVRVERSAATEDLRASAAGPSAVAVRWAISRGAIGIRPVDSSRDR